MTIIKRKCYVSGRCPDTVNVNIGPVYVIDGTFPTSFPSSGAKISAYSRKQVFNCVTKYKANFAEVWCLCGWSPHNLFNADAVSRTEIA